MILRPEAVRQRLLKLEQAISRLEEQKRQLREEIDRNVLATLDSGDRTPMTRKHWQDIEREGLKRAGTKKTRTAR